MSEQRTIFVKGNSVVLDPSLMAFNEHTLSAYIEKEAGYYDNFGAMLADAEKEMWDREYDYEVMYAERFREHKEAGCTEKLAEANSKADPDVQDRKRAFFEAKHNVRLLQQHLRAWDKNHENAQSRGHFLRKEMDKLGRDILSGDWERKVDEIVGAVDVDEIKNLQKDLTSGDTP